MGEMYITNRDNQIHWQLQQETEQRLLEKHLQSQLDKPSTIQIVRKPSWWSETSSSSPRTTRISGPSLEYDVNPSSSPHTTYKPQAQSHVPLK